MPRCCEKRWFDPLFAQQFRQAGLDDRQRPALESGDQRAVGIVADHGNPLAAIALAETRPRCVMPAKPTVGRFMLRLLRKAAHRPLDCQIVAQVRWRAVAAEFLEMLIFQRPGRILLRQRDSCLGRAAARQHARAGGVKVVGPHLHSDLIWARAVLGKHVAGEMVAPHAAASFRARCAAAASSAMNTT